MRTRECLASFKPYEWEPSSEEIARQVGLKAEDIIRFDTNTAPMRPVHLLERLSVELPTLNVNDYPDTSYGSLRRALGHYLSVDPNQVSVTAGADEALDIITKIFIDPGTVAVVSAPTYSYYATVVGALGGTVKEVRRRRDFSDDDEAIITSITPDVRVVLLCSPNNPTGNVVSRGSLVHLLESGDLPVVVDESYAEFSGKSFVDLTREYRNLIILRTFSKAFALAGVRVGYVVASEETIRTLNGVRPPNSVGVISLALAEMALKHIDLLKARVGEITHSRDIMAEELKKLKGLTIYPSEANFLLARFTGVGAAAVHRELLKRGIVARDLSNTRDLENCLRFTVRTPEENSKLCTALAEILSKSS